MKDQENPHIGDHLANERTFLAWIRTSVGIMAFGFVVVKFSLFVKQLSYVLKTTLPQLAGRGYSAIAGIGLVIAGALLTIFAFVRYRTTKKRIERQDFYQESWLLVTLTVFIFLTGISLIIYLIGNI